MKEWKALSGSRSRSRLSGDGEGRLPRLRRTAAAARRPNRPLLDSAPVPRAPYDRGRRLSDGYPGLGAQALSTYVATAQARQEEAERVGAILRDLDALIDVGAVADVAVVGCGPWPETIRALGDRGYAVVGVEPVSYFVDSAREYLGGAGEVVQGAAEALPLPDEAYDVVFLESVLEHVDSPRLAVGEVFRVLRPGGVAFVLTTNRHALSLDKAEFNVPLFGWLPKTVKESYIFFHLHYRPSLANYTERPAVHWYSFADLCSLGRDAGFAQFYSHLDLRSVDERPSGFRASARSLLFREIQGRPWLRSLALTQRGGEIFMLKRRRDAAA